MTRPLRWLSLALGLLALAALPAPPAAAEPADSLPALLTELGALYEESGRATEVYQETARRLRDQRAEVRRLNERLAATRTDLADARHLAGALAREQYRHGGAPLPDVLRLLFGEAPEGRGLHDRTVARRAARAQASEIARLAEGERRADELATAAREALDEQQTLAAEERRRRDEMRDRLAEVTRLLATLEPAGATGTTGTSETGGTADAPPAAAGVTTDQAPGSPGTRAPTPAGARALAHALDLLGSPSDPVALVTDAWARAGRTLPDSPAALWAALPQVPLGELCPGDLVVYGTDASHVALYAGDGQVVHAPGPGEPVAVAPLAVRPVLGAVTPG
ncbi:NlpC/P60 family protein [Streptomyces sp. MS19]|uniref:C40 family peptidase n=1 Tax=Streptomyces sp. MS19 TaxID=3385972 RepID=UPI0039A3F147